MKTPFYCVHINSGLSLPGLFSQLSSCDKLPMIVYRHQVIKDLIQDVSYEEETMWYSGPSCQEAFYHHWVPAGGREEGQAGNEVWHPRVPWWISTISSQSHIKLLHPSYPTRWKQWRLYPVQWRSLWPGTPWRSLPPGNPMNFTGVELFSRVSPPCG